MLVARCCLVRGAFCRFQRMRPKGAPVQIHGHFTDISELCQRQRSREKTADKVGCRRRSLTVRPLSNCTSLVLCSDPIFSRADVRLAVKQFCLPSGPQKAAEGGWVGISLAPARTLRPRRSGCPAIRPALGWHGLSALRPHWAIQFVAARRSGRQTLRAGGRESRLH
jgi:hypothetical protein